MRDPASWASLYHAAVLEVDAAKKQGLVAATRHAVAARLHNGRDVSIDEHLQIARLLNRLRELEVEAQRWTSLGVDFQKTKEPTNHA